ncbi:hypothetical protein [Embleya sp. NPDC001921]
MPAHPVIDIKHPGADAEKIASRVADAAAKGVRAALVHNDRDAIMLSPLLRARPAAFRRRVADRLRRRVRRAIGSSTHHGRTPKSTVGTAAPELLRRLGSGPELPIHHVELPPELKVRASCGTAASRGADCGNPRRGRAAKDGEMPGAVDIEPGILPVNLRRNQP